MHPTVPVRPALLLVVLLAAGCTASAPVRTDTTEQDRREALYWERQEQARSRFTPADVAFMTGMIAHHAQALVMAAWAEPNGADARVQVLAARIINAQNDEIASMQRWLSDRGQPVPDPAHAMHGHAMPGMLTPAQLDELEAARGRAFDRLFLTYMIQHHEGAVTMVDALFETDGTGQDEAVFKLASDIHVDQITEIARMKQMLAALSEPSPTNTNP